MITYEMGEIMKIGIMQPYFIPYIGYWQLINAVDKYVVYDDVNFIKGGWINRNRLLINNEPKYFNLQMSGASANKLINEVGINSNDAFKAKNLRIIEASYKKAPYFESVYPIVKEIFNYETSHLVDFIVNSFKIIANYLDIKTEFVISSKINKNNDLRGQDKVIHICKLLNGTEYYNAVGGQELYSFEEFKNNGIKLSFLQTNNIIYEQFTTQFYENLSIIDVMMFNSCEEVKNFLDEYKLIVE